MKTHVHPFTAVRISLLFAALASANGCRLPHKGELTFPFSSLVSPHDSQPDAAGLFKELGGEEAFMQLTRYLYRWYLDETDFKHFAPDFKHQLWLRTLQTVADPQDNSRYLEAVFPAIGVVVTLKKTDYQIPELKLLVRSDGYRITQIARDTSKQNIQKHDYAVMDIDTGALYKRLFQTRLDCVYPDAALLAHLKESAAQQIAALHDAPTQAKPQQPATFFVAPVHKVSNEVWGFWEEGKLLFRFTSDIDLSNPALWAHDSVNVQLYNAVEQTVVSHEERPGDDRFITRDQIGRALYNCIVLGQKISLPPGQK